MKRFYTIVVIGILSLGVLFTAINETMDHQEEINSEELTSSYTSSTYEATTLTTLYDQAEPFFNYSYVHDIYLNFNNSNWYYSLYSSHANNPLDPYFSAQFECDGVEIESIGVRFKGSSSFNIAGEKKSFKLDFTEYDSDASFLGLSKLNLNNNYLDPTMMREFLFNEFTSQFIPTIRSVFTRVYVNDEYWGFYTATENIDKTFIRSRFGLNEDGNLFRGETSGGDNPMGSFGSDFTYLGTDASNYYDEYILETNEDENDWSELIELIDVLNNAPTSDLPEQLEPLFDVENALYSIGLNLLFSNLDSYIGSAHNYYIYDRDDTGQLTHLFWDANEAFGTFSQGLGTNENILTLDPFWLPSSTTNSRPGHPGPSTSTERPLMSSLWAVDSYNRTYLRSLAQMIREGFNIDDMNVRIQELADLIRDDVYSDPKKPYTTADFETGLTDDVNAGMRQIYGLSHFIEIRSTYMENILNSFAEKTDLKINELMSSNTKTIVDNYGYYDPWIEIYNLGPGLITTDNLYLTNDPSTQNKWELPNQSLDDGESLLLWLDNEVVEGPNHASFELDPNGGELFFYLQQSDLSYILVDSIIYPSLEDDVSYGRSSDGNDEWVELSDYPTPEASNKINSIIIPENLYINEIMASNSITIEDPDDPGEFPDWIELYNAGNESIDLCGMSLTDNLAGSSVWYFSNNTIIEAGDYLLVWVDGEPEDGLLHTNFKLSSSSEEIALIYSDNMTIIDTVEFNDMLQDFSLGRIPDGGTQWVSNLLTPTPGNANQANPIIPTEDIPENLYINEIMASNSITIADPDDPDEFPDWIELYNAGNESINLKGMFLTDDLDGTSFWKFQNDTIIEAGDFLLVWADGEPEDGPLHTNFKISSSGEEIALVAADGSTIIDAVQFDGMIPNFSLGRIPDGGFEWVEYLATPTPGSANQVNPVTTSEQSENIISVIANLFISIGGLITLFGLATFITKRHNRSMLKNSGSYWEEVPKSLRKTELTKEHDE